MTDTSEPTVVQRLVGVFDADGTLRGEIAYVIGHLIGRRQCSLCDITHSWKGRKQAFDERTAALGVPFELLHRDEVPGDLADVVDAWPSVLVLTDDGPSVLLDDRALTACGGDPDALFAALQRALADRRLALPV